MNLKGKMYLVGPRGHWQATSGEVKEFFGLKINDPWPDEGMPKRVIQGFICWVDPLPEKRLSKTGKEYRPFKIRAKMFCGECGDEVPISRCKQHLKSNAHRPDDEDWMPNTPTSEK